MSSVLREIEYHRSWSNRNQNRIPTYQLRQQMDHIIADSVLFEDEYRNSSSKDFGKRKQATGFCKCTEIRNKFYKDFKLWAPRDFQLNSLNNSEPYQLFKSF